MDNHIGDFFCSSNENAPKGHFHNVIALHQVPDFKWEDVKEKSPTLPKGWFELANLDAQSRIDFTYAFWLSKLPYHPNLSEGLERFFGLVDEIGIYLTQQSFGDPFLANFVYSLKDNRGYFCGGTPVFEKDVDDLKSAFAKQVFPKDYMAFMEIHNGFRKGTDCTGIIPLSSLKSSFENFQKFLQEQDEPPMTSEGKLLDPKSLIPFYESFGMPFFQCFWADWHPEQEMGNVYYSGVTHSISAVEDVILGCDSMAFPSFTDWFLFYLEQIE